MNTNVGAKLKKRYEIRELLGQGEHGKTWKAWDSGSAPHKFCVIKEPVGSPHAIKELEAESAAAGLLHHKNIVPVLEFNESDGFLVEEFVPGRSLQARPREDARKSTWPTLHY
jgi:eukaryotic-like serine/threonine-protein kinase